MRTNPWHLIRDFGFVGCWLIFILLMAVDGWQDPYNPNLIGTEAYGHNHKEALIQGFTFTSLELGILYLIVRPRSFHRSWLRIIGAIVLFFPWTFLMIFVTMHGGGIMLLHLLWLLVVDLILVLILMWTLLKIILGWLGSS